MTYDDEMTAVRARLDDLAQAAPPVGFDPGHLVTRGRRLRRRRTGLAVSGSAAAFALVVAVPAVALHTGPTTTTPAASPSVTVSAAEADRIVRECTSKPDGTGPLPGLEGARLYNVVRDRYGTIALVIGRTIMLDCLGSAQGFRPGGGAEDGPPAGNFLDWLPGAVALDLIEGDGTLGSAAWTSVAGRVSPAVASVVVRVDDQSRRVTPANGTFLARFPNPAGTAPATPAAGTVQRTPPAGTEKRQRITATAYDADGRMLGISPDPGTCHRRPDGSEGTESPSGVRCEPGTRWR
jgi:hypothetical protein